MGRKVSTGTATSNQGLPAALQITGSTISATQANANITLTPNGTGTVDAGSANITTSGNLTGNTLTISTITNNNTGNTANFNIINATGLATFNEITEITSTLTGATGVVTHDFANGGIFYHTAPAANWTANFTNVPTTDNRAIAMVLVINQGATGRYPSAVQVNGSAVTLRWANNTTPTPGTNKIEIASFTLLRISSTWIVVGNYTSFA